jgi:hypothetical protein
MAAEVQAILDDHPANLDRAAYLRRALAQQLLLLDRLEVTFGQMAFEDRDTAAGALLVKVAERRATLLGMNAPISHSSFTVVETAAPKQTSTDRIEKVINEFLEMDRANRAASDAAADPSATH